MSLSASLPTGFYPASCELNIFWHPTRLIKDVKNTNLENFAFNYSSNTILKKWNTKDTNSFIFISYFKQQLKKVSNICKIIFIL